MEKYAEETDAESGKTTINGEDLNRAVLEEISRSVASIGHDASARIQETVNSKVQTRHLKGDLIAIEEEQEKIRERLDDLHKRLISAYESVRKQKN